MTGDDEAGAPDPGDEDPGAPAPGGGGPPPGSDPLADGLSDEEGPVGIFPSWGWVYGTVLVWFVVVVVALYVLTVTLDYGAP